MIYLFFYNTYGNYLGYIIYKPTCVDFDLESGIYEDADKLIDYFFEKKTNTRYYIYFNNVPDTYGCLSLNEEEIVQGINNKFY